MPGYNQYTSNSNNFNNSIINTTSVENKGIFSKLLRSISNNGYGMDYQDMIIRNQVGIGMNEDPTAQSDMYDELSKQRRAIADVLSNKSISYLDKAYQDKKRILREYSIKDEIRDYVTTVADECIDFDDTNRFCSPANLPADYSNDIKDKYQETFERIYNAYDFNDSIKAWSLIRDFLIDGYVALEIIYDDKKKNIIGFNRMLPETLIPAYENGIGNLWIQYPENPQLRRIFLDSQIIYISYTTQNDFAETSYVEGLIRPYNQLKLLEETRIMYNIINASVYQKFTVPLKNISSQKAKERMGKLIADYNEEVTWDDSLGTVQINGQKHLPYNKQLWFPETNEGTPNLELVAPQGHDLNESDILKWFRDILQRASKIPLQRFNTDNGGGNIIDEASEITRDEMQFHKFINRIRANFKELLVKPIRMQMLMDFPELKSDNKFLNNIDILYNSNQLFEEWKKIGNLQKKAEAINSLLGIQKADGNPYFHIDYLMDTIMKMTPDEKSKNDKYWAISNGAATAEGVGEAGEEGGGEEYGGDHESFGGGEENGGGIEAPQTQSAPEETPPENNSGEGGFEF